MKQYFNITFAVEIDSEDKIENITDLQLNLKLENSKARLKVVDIPEAFEVLV